MHRADLKAGIHNKRWNVKLHRKNRKISGKLMADSDEISKNLSVKLYAFTNHIEF